MSDSSSLDARYYKELAAITASAEETTTAWLDLARRGLARRSMAENTFDKEFAAAVRAAALAGATEPRAK